MFRHDQESAAPAAGRIGNTVGALDPGALDPGALDDVMAEKAPARMCWLWGRLRADARRVAAPARCASPMPERCAADGAWRIAAPEAQRNRFNPIEIGSKAAASCPRNKRR